MREHIIDIVERTWDCGNIENGCIKHKYLECNYISIAKECISATVETAEKLLIAIWYTIDAYIVNFENIVTLIPFLEELGESLPAKY